MGISYLSARQWAGIISKLKDQNMNPRMIEMFATFFYLGRAPLMSGTVGTLGAIPLIFILNMFGIYTYMILTFVFILFAVSICDAYENQVHNHDSPEIVIDEVAGYMIAMVWLPLTWQSFLYTFLFFRFLDILKPPPISIIDKNIRGGFGIMLDDIVAGIIVNITFQFVYTQTTWLGSQF